MPHRTCKVACFVIAAGVLIWIASEIIPRSRYGNVTGRINEKICSLIERSPNGVDEKDWIECVMWASIAHCNICFSEGHTSFEAMRRFERELDEELQGHVGPDTMRWIFGRLAATGPTGHTYIEGFKVHWTDSLSKITEREN